MTAIRQLAIFAYYAARILGQRLAAGVVAP